LNPAIRQRSDLEATTLGRHNRRMQGPGLLAVFGVLGVLVSDASAQTYCSLPIRPLCSTDVLATDTDTERMRCIGDTARYIEDLVSYRDCLANALGEAKEMVAASERFRNCLEEASDDCLIEEVD
jgi:hypothetical protein